jgi:hypothetical protein
MEMTQDRAFVSAVLNLHLGTCDVSTGKQYMETAHEIIILPVVLYYYEVWYLTLREEHRLRVYEKRVLRRIFGPKRAELTGGWRTLHNEEVHNLYSSRNIIRVTKSRRMR